MYSPRYGPGAEIARCTHRPESLVHPRPKLFLRNRVGLQHGIRLHFNTGILRVLQVVYRGGSRYTAACYTAKLDLPSAICWHEILLTVPGP